MSGAAPGPKNGRWNDNGRSVDNRPRSSNHPRWNDGRIIDERGYVMLRVGIGHPLANSKGYAYEHRAVWCSAGRRKPRSGEVVHHINGDRSDNRLENLAILQAGDHSILPGAREERMDGCLLDGVFVPGRSLNSKYGTQSPSKLSSILGRDVAPHFDQGKHLYWLPIFRSGEHKAKRLGLESLPYPKPNAARLLDEREPSRASHEHTVGAAPLIEVA